MMEFSSLLMFKILGIVLCNNFFARMFIILFLLLEVSSGIKRKKVLKKRFIDLFIGASLICLNSILTLNFFAINFLFLGVGSFFLKKMKIEKYINIYFLTMMIEGVVELCLSLQ